MKTTPRSEPKLNLFLAFLIAAIGLASGLNVRAALPPKRSTHYDGSTSAWVSFGGESRFDSNLTMTVEAWVYREDANRTEAIVSHAWPGSYWFGFAPRLRFYRGGTNYVESSVVVPARQWTHVAVSYDGTFARFYIDGQGAGTFFLPNTGANKLRRLQLAHDWRLVVGTQYYNVFQGYLDEVRLWSAARSQAEILARMSSELRDEPGLAAVFPQGGRIEGIGPTNGLAGSAAVEQVLGVLPRALVVPRAATPIVMDGRVLTNSEYLGAEQLVLRYRDGAIAHDAVAHLVHDDNNLYVGLRNLRDTIGPGWPDANSSVSLFVDPNFSRDPIATRPHIQLRTFLDFDDAHSDWRNGDGVGGYLLCPAPQPCTPASAWQVKKYVDSEFSPPTVEFRIARSQLGEWNEIDGLALGQFGVSATGTSYMAPDEALPNVPASWTRVTYGDGSADLPIASVSGLIYAGPDRSARGLPGHPVELIAGGLIRRTTTDANGRWRFDVNVPVGVPIRIHVVNCDFCKYAPPQFEGNGTPGALVTPTGDPAWDNRNVDYPACSANTCAYQSVNFFLEQPPAGPVSLTLVDPTAATSGTVVRQGVPPVGAEVVTIYGANLHRRVNFYLSPVLAGSENPVDWVKFPASVVPNSLTPTSVELLLPTGLNPAEPSWRWVAEDIWTRPGVRTWNWLDGFRVKQQPYPLIHGFNFKNKDLISSAYSFSATYGNNAYVCVLRVPLEGTCLLRVQDPIYWVAWLPVYLGLMEAGDGLCLGMASTSQLMSRRRLLPASFDPLANYAAGISDPLTMASLPDHWDSSAFDLLTGPATPGNLWAHIIRNQGVQYSSEFIEHLLGQVNRTLEFPDPICTVVQPGIHCSLRLQGNPVARLNELRARPLDYVVCMVDGLTKGHCVTPYAVQDGVDDDGDGTVDRPHVSRIWVYDNNWPCALGPPPDSMPLVLNRCIANRFIDVDRTANRYRFELDYDSPPEFYEGTGLFTAPIALWDHGFSRPGLGTALELAKVLVLGQADALHTTPDGAWGWRPDGVMVSSLPYARWIPSFSSPTNESRAIPLLLPPTTPPPVTTINVRGTHYCFHAEAGGHTVQLEKSEAVSGDHDVVSIQYESNRVSSFRFTPQRTSASLTPKVGMEFGERSCAVFHWAGLEVEAGRALEFKARPEIKGVEVRNDSTRATTHYVRIDAVDGASTHVTCSVFGPFTIPPGAAQWVGLHEWPSGARARAATDLNRDGTPDQVIVVEGMPVDSDGDGLSDAWEMLHRLNPFSPAGHDGATGDPDHDGVPNLAEQNTGTDPQNAASLVVVRTNSVWKYLADGSDQGTTWREATYNDSAWPVRPAPLGYGDGDEATVIPFGPDPNNKPITTYFRHPFSLGNPGAVTGLRLRLWRDDGAVVYLNGQEVFRNNLPAGSVTYRSPASPAVDDGALFLETNLPPSLLLTGTNLLAVEVHQWDPTSSDVSFELELVAAPPPPFGGIRLEPMGHGLVRVSWPLPESGAVLYHTTTLGNWAPLPPPYSTNATSLSVIRSEPAEFFILRRP